METKTINWKPTKKQEKALDRLEDNETTECLFGGGAGGGKTFLGCAWLIIGSIKYPSSRWCMCRAILKTLKETTLLTFFAICKEWGIQSEVHYKYNAHDNVIKWFNGSEIYLKDLFAYPSDPEFDELGSTEYTGAFIDEASQVTTKAKSILMSRIRYKLDEFGIIPKLFIASNPSKNFLYYEFYKPDKSNSLPTYRKFIQALVIDNPYISKYYIENLKKLDSFSKERLLHGNWEYEDDPSKLMDYDKIVDLFTNTFIRDQSTEKFITCDPARFGRDRTVIMLWKGLYVEKIFAYAESSNVFTEDKINQLAEQEKVPRSNIIVDEDGIGGGIVDHLVGIKGFVSNSTPLGETNYRNLKAQCYFELANYINQAKLGINVENDFFKELIIEDLEQVKRKDIDKDGKLTLVSKEQVKENIGRSPDFGDCLMMRMFFEIQPKREFIFEISRSK